MKSLLERLGKLSGRERLILAAAAAGVVLLIVDRAVVSPVQSHLAETRQRIELRKREILVNEKNAERISSVGPLYKETVGRIHGSGSGDQDSVELLHEVEKIGSESQVRLSNVKPRAPKPLDRYRVLGVDVEMECDMKKLMTFLHKLHGAGRLFRVETLKIRPHENEEILRVSLVLTRIVLDEAGSAGSVGSAGSGLRPDPTSVKREARGQ